MNMSYLDMGFNNLLSKITVPDLSQGINNANIDEFIGSGAVGFEQSSMRTLHINQDMASKNFQTGVSGWRIKGNGTAEFQTVIAGAYIKVFVQGQITDGIPTSLHINDIWYDSDNNNTPYRAVIIGADQIVAGEWDAIDNPTEWADVLDGAITKPSNNADVTSASPQPVSWLTDAGLLATKDNVNTAEIVAGAVTKVKMALGAVDADILAANAVTENKLYTGAVTADKIGANAVTSAKIMAGSVIAGKIAADAVTATEINVSQLSAISANIGDITAGTITGLTITGGVLQTSTSGKRVVVSNDKIQIYNASNQNVATIEGGDQSGLFDIIGLNEVMACNYFAINKDALIGVDIGDLTFSTRKAGGGGGNIKFIPEITGEVYSYGDINLAAGKQYKINGSPLTTGEVNTASNIGGTGWYSNKSGSDLQFKGIEVSSWLALTNYSDRLYIAHQTGSGYKHIPSGGSSYQTLRYSSSGTVEWSSDVYATYFRSLGYPSTYIYYSGSSWEFNSAIYSNNNITGVNITASNNMTCNYIYSNRLYAGSYYFYQDGSYLKSSTGFSVNGTLVASTITASSATITGEIYASGGSIHTSGNVYTGGYGANEGSVNCAVVGGDGGGFLFDYVGRIQTTTHLDPPNAGGYNLGGSVRYWNDVSYKTLTDRGCLGWFDEGVELQDGRVVNDVQALKEIKKHPTKKTIYGVSMLDYKTLPKVVYKKAVDNNGKKLLRDENDEPYIFEEIKDIKLLAKTTNDETQLAGEQKVKIKAADGAELTSLISIIIGAIKELDGRLLIIEK